MVGDAANHCCLCAPTDNFNLLLDAGAARRLHLTIFCYQMSDIAAELLPPVRLQTTLTCCLMLARHAKLSSGCFVKACLQRKVLCWTALQTSEKMHALGMNAGEWCASTKQS
jgi:hypothetical protein